MQFLSIAPLLLASIASAMSLQTRALAKANEYPQDNCLDDNGGNKPTYHHSTLCGCVTMDLTTVSVYTATSSSQYIMAFTNSACNPGTNNTEYLGTIGGQCHSIDDQFDEGPMQSLLFYVPEICDIVTFLEKLPEEAQAGLDDILKAL